MKPPSQAFEPATSGREPGSPRVPLVDGTRVVVIGGGPAGAFFAISLLRQARERGIRPEVVILEGRRALAEPSSVSCGAGPSSCNYCAGGISPPLNDLLDELGIPLPADVIQSRIRAITIQAHWKNIELRVPEERSLVCVYRGSRPRTRAGRDVNFDSFLLDRAREAGADVRVATVRSIARTSSGRLRIGHIVDREGSTGRRSMEADFVVFAGGVNHVPGMNLPANALVRNLVSLMPGFRPPRIRRTMIFEIDLGPRAAPHLHGELFFVLYGSRDLRLEMGSIMPKGRFATVVLIGPDIDRRKGPRATAQIVRAFLELPHIRRVLPRTVSPSDVGCVCGPNMVVGPARRPFGDRIAVIGDMVTSRLYKDGLHSAQRSASALATGLLKGGLDGAGLRRTFWPAIRALNSDHWCGRLLFACTSIAFRRPVLSRIAYQAVLTERKTRSRPRRRLESVLWKIASGDDSYRSILGAMTHPATIFRFLVGGGLVTLRNYFTELAFGLRWRGFERFPTGVFKEDRDAKTRRLESRLGLTFGHLPVVRMYAIRVLAPAHRVYRELGRFGERDRSFFHPRHVSVRRVAGRPNEIGTVLRYEVAFRFLSFSVALQDLRRDRHLLFRVRDGFARGGLLVFDIEDRGDAECELSVHVAFRVRGQRGPVGTVLGHALRLGFPVFVHDVLWNHALCQLKHAVEADAVISSPGDPPPDRRRTGTPGRTV